MGDASLRYPLNLTPNQKEEPDCLAPNEKQLNSQQHPQYTNHGNSFPIYASVDRRQNAPYRTSSPASSSSSSGFYSSLNKNSITSSSASIYSASATRPNDSASHQNDSASHQHGPASRLTSTSSPSHSLTPLRPCHRPFTPIPRGQRKQLTTSAGLSASSSNAPASGVVRGLHAGVAIGAVAGVIGSPHANLQRFSASSSDFSPPPSLNSFTTADENSFSGDARHKTEEEEEVDEVANNFHVAAKLNSALLKEPNADASSGHTQSFDASTWNSESSDLLPKQLLAGNVDSLPKARFSREFSLAKDEDDDYDDVSNDFIEKHPIREKLSPAGKSFSGIDEQSSAGQSFDKQSSPGQSFAGESFARQSFDEQSSAGFDSLPRHYGKFDLLGRFVFMVEGKVACMVFRKVTVFGCKVPSERVRISKIVSLVVQQKMLVYTVIYEGSFLLLLEDWKLTFSE